MTTGIYWKKGNKFRVNFPFYIAKRYLRSASKNNAINIINGIAAVGVVVGAMALFVVLSVFSGLKDFSLSFSDAFDPDIKISTNVGKSFIFSEVQEKELKKTSGIAAYSKIIEERVLFVYGDKQLVTEIKGVDANFTKVTAIKDKLFAGNWLEKNTVQVVLGYGIAHEFSLGLFDFNTNLEVYVPKTGNGTIETPEDAFTKSVVMPNGIYAVSEELDSKYIFADLGFTQELLNYKTNEITGLELQLAKNANEAAIIKKLQQLFNNQLIVKNRAQQNDALYKMLNTENIAVYLIFTLVIIIALFNLVGALIMMILDKKSNLRTLANLGVEIIDLRKIFLLQGTLLSVFGGMLGLIIGSIIVLVQQQFEIIMITPSLAYPVSYTLKNVLVVLITIVVLGFLASIIASSRVTKKMLG